MKNLLIVLVLLVVGVAALGFYRGWFRYSTAGADGKGNPSITVDQEKIKADKERAREKAQEFGQKVKEKTGGAADKGKEEARRP
jgi:hypothetical protein